MSFARSVSARLDRTPPRKLKTAIAVLTGLLLFGLITHGHYAASGDAVHYLIISRSVIFDGDFDLANNYADPRRLMDDAPALHARPGRDGALRPVHDVGLPTLAAPVVGLAYRLAPLVDRLPESTRRKAKLNESIAFRQLICLFMIGVTCVLAVRMFSASVLATGLTSAAFAWSLLYALSPPVQTHAYLFLTEIPTALLALVIYLRLDTVRGPQALRSAVVLGVLIGLLLLIHVRNIGLVLALAFLVVWRLERATFVRRTFVTALAAMLILRVGVNWWFWGTLFSTPHAHFPGWIGFDPFLRETLTRTLGLLFDPTHGLLFSAPIYLLAPAALMLLARRSRGTAVELTLIVVCYLAFVVNPITNFHGWRGGWSPAARFLVPITPFLAIGLPLLVTSRLGTIVTAVVVALQVVVSAVQWGNPILTFHEGGGKALWIQKLAGPSVAGSLPSWDVLTPMLALGAGVAILLWWWLTRAIVSRGPEQSPSS